MSGPGSDPGAPATTVVIVADGAPDVVIGRLDGRAPDMVLVNALMRLQLGARRRGAIVKVRDASDELLGLLELVGLADVLTLEPRRQPELGEHLGVEEVVQPGDPAG